MEEQESGAQIVKVEPMTRLTVSEDALFVRALVIKHLNAGIRMEQDHLMWEEERKLMLELGLELVLELLELVLILQLEQRSLAREPDAEET